MEKLNDYWFGRMEKGLLPESQFGLACFPTFSDASMAPEGHHVLNIILAGPYDIKELDWERDRESVR